MQGLELVAGAALTFIATKLGRAGSSPVPDVPVELPSGSTETRGIRNRNPGNVTVLGGGKKWRGQIGEDVAPDGHVYAVFDSQHHGLRACARLLRNYQRLHRLSTVRELISRYAPPVANPTGDYVDFVARALQVGPDAPILLSDDGMLVELVLAVVHFENGFPPFSAHAVMQAVADA